MSTEAVIFLCDVVNYSREPDARQSEIVRSLWDEAILFVDGFQEPDRGLIDCWGTGDGLYLVKQDPRVEFRLTLEEFARKLISDSASKGYSIRAALHFGPVERVPVKSDRHELSGTGLNDAARIVGFAAPGQIVFSEAFLDPIFRQKKLKARYLDGRLHPHKDEPAHRLEVKHGFPMLIRFDSDATSHRMAAIGQYIKLIRSELDNLLEQACTLVYQSSNGAALDGRISIFRLEIDESEEQEWLTSTMFRRSCQWTGKPSTSRGSSAEAAHELSRTLYRITKPQGLGNAYKYRRPLHCLSLADPQVDLAGYQSELDSRWDVPMEVSGSWKRKARSFFAIPLTISEGESPEAVLCIDFVDPLDHLENEEATKIAESIADFASFRLCPLWRLFSGS